MNHNLPISKQKLYVLSFLSFLLVTEKRGNEKKEDITKDSCL